MTTHPKAVEHLNLGLLEETRLPNVRVGLAVSTHLKKIYIYNILVGSHGLGMEDEPTGRRCSDQTGRLSDSGSARGVSLDHGGAPGICFEHRKNDRFLNGGERCGLDGVGGVQRFQVSGVSGWY